MPTYDYKCQDCGHELEAFHSMKADPLIDCPACGKPALRRKIGGGAGIIFKGSGFYETDYRRTSKSSGEGEGATSSEKSSGSGEKSAPATSTPTPASSHV